MGRARASMQLIQKPKTKRVTCEKRGESLKKKATELSELCDVDVCLIMYPPAVEGGAAEAPKIWPEDPEKINKLIELFNSVRADENRCKFSTVATYFKDRKRKTEGELDKLRKKNREARYPTWSDTIANLPEETSKDLGRNLTAKIDEVKRRIDDVLKMRRVPTSSNNTNNVNNNINFSSLLAGSGFSSNFGHNIPQHHPIFNPYHPMNIPTNSYTQMMLEEAGASTTTAALTSRYMVEQPPFVGNVVSRSYNNTNVMAPQLGYNVGYNMARPQSHDWKPCNTLAALPPGMNGFALTESFRVLGTSSVSGFKVDQKEAPHFHM